MKKIITPVAVGGFPLRNEDVTGILQNQLFGLQETYYQNIVNLTPQTVGIGRGIIINSLELSGTDTNFTVNNVNSLVYLDGELMRCSSTTSPITFTQSVYIVPDTTITETRSFADGQVRNATQERKFTFTTSLPSGLDYIKLQPSLGPIRRLESLLFNINSEVGEVKMVATNTILSQFSQSTGLGTGKWNGWALADGRNGTVNLKSSVPMGYDPAGLQTPTTAPTVGQNNSGALGNRGGNLSITLSLGQLPNSTRNVDVQTFQPNSRVNVNGLANSALGSDFQVYSPYTSGGNTLFGNPLNATSPVVSSGFAASVNNGGNGDPIDNRQPYTVVLFVQKIS